MKDEFWSRAVFSCHITSKSALPRGVFLSSLFLLNLISRIIFAVSLPALKRDLGIRRIFSGLFLLLIANGCFTSIVGSNFLSSVFSYKKIVSLCIPLAFLFGAGIIPTLIGLVGDFHSLGLSILSAGIIIVVGGEGLFGKGITKAMEKHF